MNGAIGRQLEALKDSDTVRILEMAYIVKDENGEVHVGEETDPELAKIMEGVSAEKGLITDEDIQETGEQLENGTAAGLLIVEHLWAIPLKIALLENGGSLIARGSIHPEAEEQLK
jgi:uncharacterized membrane protein